MQYIEIVPRCPTCGHRPTSKNGKTWFCAYCGDTYTIKVFYKRKRSSFEVLESDTKIKTR